MNEMLLLDSSLVFERAIEFDVRHIGEEHWTQKFYDPYRDKYDWDDPEWKAQNEKNPLGFYPIYLTQGYFMIVSKRDYKRMTTWPDGTPKKWCAQVDRDEDGVVYRVYACRHGRGDEPSTPLAHRDILRCLYAKEQVDHVNGWGLDNRANKNGVNLILETASVNMFNAGRSRTANIGLPRGAEKRGLNKEGKQRYGGIRSQRIKKSGKGSVKTIRSRRTWLSPEPANLWYLNQIKRLSGGRSKWAHVPGTVHYPVFPPLKVHADVPF